MSRSSAIIERNANIISRLGAPFDLCLGMRSGIGLQTLAMEETKLWSRTLTML